MSEKPAVNDYPCANEAWTSIPAAGTEHEGKGLPQEFCIWPLHHRRFALPAWERRGPEENSR